MHTRTGKLFACEIRQALIWIVSETLLTEATALSRVVDAPPPRDIEPTEGRREAAADWATKFMPETLVNRVSCQQGHIVQRLTYPKRRQTFRKVEVSNNL